MLILSFYHPPGGDGPITQGGGPKQRQPFHRMANKGEIVYPPAPSWPCSQVILCPLVLDLLLSWMHLSSLAGALMCDCLTAAASCPRDPGPQGA